MFPKCNEHECDHVSGPAGEMSCLVLDKQAKLKTVPNNKRLCGCFSSTDIDNARTSDPEGLTCHFCGKENDFADDVGFFYILDPTEAQLRNEKGILMNEIYPACNQCYFSKREYHIAIYGLGDR
jgi:hypothetical protein